MTVQQLTPMEILLLRRNFSVEIDRVPLNFTPTLGSSIYLVKKRKGVMSIKGKTSVDLVTHMVNENVLRNIKCL